MKLIATLWFWTTTAAYNVDIRHPIVFPESDSENSYFGFKVAFSQVPETIFVTAPRKTSTVHGERTPRFGALYKCVFTTLKCTMIELEKPSFDKSQMIFNESLVGSSLQIDPYRGKALVCGHKHKVTKTWKYYNCPNDFIPNGACYALDNKSSSSQQRILPMKLGINTSVCFPVAGFSTTFTKDKLVIGVPIAETTTVDVQRRTIKGLLLEFDATSYSFNKRVELPIENNDSYLGYSLASGRNQSPQLIVVGAPRDNNLKGKVVVWQVVPYEVKTLEGRQLGEYFGAAVLTVDINGDREEDLLVGAPLYSSSARGEEGRVFVFMVEGTRTPRQKYILTGQAKPKARFGSALANLGDLDRDGIKDFAVGAPYEDDGGTVYIYQGRRNGAPSLAQIIAAEDVPSRRPVRGFGISIAGDRDIDDNKYKDILVGAYDSGHAVLLRSNPIVQLTGKITFTVRMVDIEDDKSCQKNGKTMPCFSATFCATFTGQDVPSTARLTMTVHVDRGFRKPRIDLDYEGQVGTTVTKNMTVNLRNPDCFPVRCDVIIDKKQDYLTPIEFLLTVNYSQSRPDDRFCKSCPVLARDKPTAFTRKLPFKTNCGSDGECKSDLRIRVQGPDGMVIVGRDTIVALRVEVRNSGDPAYRSQVNITTRPEIIFKGNPDCEDDRETSQRNASFLCEAGNPLRDLATLEVRLDISKLQDFRKQGSIFLRQFPVEVNATTTSKDSETKNNFAQVLVNLTYEADIRISGHAKDAEITFSYGDDRRLRVEHRFAIQKIKSSPVSMVLVTLKIPRRLQKDDPNNVIAVVKNNREDIVNCSDHTSQLEAKKTSTSRLSRSTRLEDCPTAPCTTFVCSIKPLLDYIPTVITVELEVNVTAPRKDSGKRQATSLVTTAAAHIQDEWIFPPTSLQVKSAKAETVVVNLPRAATVATWVLVVSIIAGVLGLIIIAVVLLKVGFFRRKRQEEMRRVLEEEQEPGTVVDPDWTPYMAMDDGRKRSPAVDD